MKIAEFFIALGFKVEGDGQALQKVDRNLNKAEVSALGLLAAVGAVNAAFYAMMNRAVDAAVALDAWGKATGLATDQVQRLEYGAARANVAAGTISNAIKAIQKTRNEIALGNVDASSPWFLLGIDPRQDPIKVIEQLRVALSQMDPSLARTMTQRMGFSDEMLYLLQQKQKFGTLFVTREEIDRLTQLGGAWRAFLFNLSTIATKFAATFADQLARIVNWLERGTTLLDRFVRWLTSGTTAANAFRNVLFAIVVLLGFAGIALAAVVTLLGILKGVLIAIQLIPIVASLSALVAVIAIMAAALVGLILLVEDFWTQIDGGKSLFDWNQNLVLTVRNVERLAGAIQQVMDLWHQLKGDTNFAKAFGVESGKMLLEYGSGYGFAKDFVNWNWRKGGSGGGTTNQTNVEINVDGARDPVTTGREVGRAVGREISDALGTAPLPTN